MRADDHLTVGVTQHVKVGTAQFVEAGSEIHYYAGQKVVVEGAMELTAKAGGSFVKVDAGGVTISGAEVKVNTGGAPGVGTPAAPLLPGPMKLADADKAGKAPLPVRLNESGITPLCGKQITSLNQTTPLVERLPI